LAGAKGGLAGENAAFAGATGAFAGANAAFAGANAAFAGANAVFAGANVVFAGANGAFSAVGNFSIVDGGQSWWATFRRKVATLDLVFRFPSEHGGKLVSAGISIWRKREQTDWREARQQLPFPQ
jgi:hypothetical protein